MQSPQSTPSEAKQTERSLHELESEIGELSAHLDAATCRLLLCIAEYDRREGWASGGFRSCAHWLAWRVGLDLGAARERLRVGRALERLPRTCAAFAAGQLSYSKVRAISRVATPETEEQLLEVARHGTASHLEKLVRLFRQGSSAEEVARAHKQQQERYLESWTDDAGMLVLRARLPPEVGALLQQALEAAMAELRQAEEPEASAEPLRPNTVDAPLPEEPQAVERSEPEQVAKRELEPEQVAERELHESLRGTSVPWGPVSRVAPLREPGALSQAQRRADALGLVARRALDASEAAAPPGREGRFEVVLHVDAKVLSQDAPLGRCELSGGPRVSAETARRIACSSPLVTLLEGEGGQVLEEESGRRTRRISAPLWRALSSRDQTCQFPGCTVRHGLVVHHVKHWAHGGQTTLENLVCCCKAHHWALHEGGFRVEGSAPDRLTFFTPQGRELEASPMPPPLEGPGLAEQNRALGLTIGPETGLTRWGGETMDYDWAVASLLHRSAALDGSNAADGDRR